MDSVVGAKLQFLSLEQKIEMQTESTLINFISNELITDTDGVAITADDRLLTTGLLDSLSVMQLVTFLEEEFNTAIPPEHITVENFQTVRNIVNYLQESASVANT